jgi:uncharacterized protein (TIGR01777 family)
MPQKVLITGGTGLIGSRLTELLLEKGYEVAYLSRRKSEGTRVKAYLWDLDKGYVAEEAIREADCIIHLAGAGVADERWTSSRKKEILESRTRSSRLLYEGLQRTPNKVKTLLSASAIGIYGADRGEELLTETSSPGNDFLAEVTKAWEGAVQPVAGLGIRTVLLRIGIVLSDKGGALAKMAQPVRLGAGSPLGSGKQWVSWIHVDDLCRLFFYCLENPEVHGPYNAVAPEPATNEVLTKQIAEVLDKPLFMPNVPAFALKLAVGEMAATVLGSARVSSQKITQAGFTYQFPGLTPALRDLLG